MTMTLLGRLLALLLGRRPAAPGPPPGWTPAPPRPETTVLPPHEREKLVEAARQLQRADERLEYMRDRANALGVRERRGGRA